MAHRHSYDHHGQAPAASRAQAATTHWPAGWWVIPSAVFGLGIWVAIFRLIASLF